MRGAAGELEEVAVGDVAGGRVDRHLAGAGLQVAVQEVGADVVALRQIQPPHLNGQCSFGRWRMTGWPWCTTAGVSSALGWHSGWGGGIGVGGSRSDPIR